MQNSDTLSALVTELWQDALGTSVKYDDQFFELGGDSLLAMQVIYRLTAQTGLALSEVVHAMYDSRTLGHFISKLTTCSSSPSVAPSSGGFDDLQAVAEDSAEGSHFPLSFSQEGLVLLDQLHPNNASYNIPFSLRIRGPLDHDSLTSAANSLFARHDALRTRIALSTHSGRHVQIVEPYVPFHVQTIDLTAFPDDTREAKAEGYLINEETQPFQLLNSPLTRSGLIRLQTDDHIFFLTMHHAISDGWSVTVIVRDLSAFYHAHVDSRRPTLPALPLRYVEYSSLQRRLVEKELEEHKNYWLRQLNGAPDVLEIPTDKLRPGVQDFVGAGYSFSLAEDVTSKLRTIAESEQSTLFIMVLSAYSLLLARYASQDDLLVGVPIANRRFRGTENAVGFFMNTVVVRATISYKMTFRQLLRSVRNTIVQAFAHGDLPLERIVEAVSPNRTLSRQPLFQVMLNFIELAEIKDLPRNWEVSFGSHRSSKFDLSLYMRTAARFVRFEIEYATSLFDRSTIQRFACHLLNLLHRASEFPDIPIAELKMADDDERNNLLTLGCGRRLSIPDQSLYDLVRRQVAMTPNAVAVSQGGMELSYCELDQLSGTLAQHFRSIGVTQGSAVAVYLPRSIDWLAALLAIVRAGATYVPIDPEHPTQRVEAMIADANATVIVTDSERSTRIPPSRLIHVVDVAELSSASTHENDTQHSSVSPESLAYIMFTSGSTGTPKGVMIDHQKAASYIVGMQDVFCLKPGDSVLQVTSSAFDPSLREIFSTLAAGAKLVVPEIPEQGNPVAYRKMIAEGKVTKIVAITPSVLKVMLEDVAPSDFSESRLELLSCSGEALSPDLVRRARTLFGQKLRILNLYGPTETTMTCCFHEVQDPSDFGYIPIGKPMPNTSVYVVDSQGDLLPVGMPGELWIGGMHVGRGYVGQHTARNQDKFLPDPFRSGGRVYRTGDRVQWSNDGTLRFLGRIDRQIKISGVRIEPDEIEVALRKCDGVADALVIGGGDIDHSQRLIAYIVPASFDVAPDHAALRQSLRALLPAYMIPTGFLNIDGIPLTINGKVDIARLPEFASETADVLPADQITCDIAAIWGRVLKLNNVGQDADFFLLGGHSLAAFRTIQLVNRHFSISLPLRTIFEVPVLRHFSTFVENAIANSRNDCS